MMRYTVSVMGAKVPQNKSSRERKFPSIFVPGSESSGSERAREQGSRKRFLTRKRKGHGANGPQSELTGSESARVLLIDSLQEAWSKWLGAHYTPISG